MPQSFDPSRLHLNLDVYWCADSRREQYRGRKLAAKVVDILDPAEGRVNLAVFYPDTCGMTLARDCAFNDGEPRDGSWEFMEV